MKKVLSLGLAAVAFAAAYAYPTLAGPTGNGVLPTSDLAGAGNFNIAADYYASDDSVVPVRALYGIGQNFEVGLSYRAGDQIANALSESFYDDGTFVEEGLLLGSGSLETSISDMWGINAKYLTPLTFGGFNWAVGAQYLSADTEGEASITLLNVDELYGDPILDENGNYTYTTDSETGPVGDYKATQVYFVGTRNLSDLCPCPGDTVLRGTLGVNWTKVEADVLGVDEDDEVSIINSDEDAFRFFLGLDATFANKLMLAAEYQTKEEDLGDTDALYAVTARYPFSNNLAGQIGFTNEVGGVLGGDDSNFFVGLNYAFTSGFCQ